MVLKVIRQDLARLEADAVLAGFYEDVRPLKGVAGALDWVLCGALSRLVIDGKVRGALGDVALLTANGKVHASKVFLVGFGPRHGAAADALRTAARTMASSAVSAGVARAILDCFPLGGTPADGEIAAVRDGLAEGAGAHPVEFALLAPDASSLDRMARLVRA